MNEFARNMVDEAEFGMMDLVMSVFREYRNDLIDAYGKLDYSAKDDASRVTEFDIAIEKVLRQKMLEEYAETGFKGEETGYETKNEKYLVVDPIDGTENFIRGMPGATNMAAYVENGETIWAIIYDFANDDVYWARRGKGAWKNQERLRVRKGEGHYLTTIHSVENMEEWYRLLRPRGVRMQIVATAGYEGALLAGGHTDGYMKIREKAFMEHDERPAMLIAEEAGAEVIDLDGEVSKKNYKKFVVATPELTKIIKEEIRK